MDPFGVQRAQNLRLETRKSKLLFRVPLVPYGALGGLIIALLYFIFMSSLKETLLCKG